MSKSISNNLSQIQVENSKILSLEEEIKQMELVAVESKNELLNLMTQLQQAKLFMNMVIHDTRNPTNSIKVGLKETIKQQQQIEVLLNEAKEFTDKNEQL